jgi:hypothetical protein
MLGVNCRIGQEGLSLTAIGSVLMENPIV